MSSIALSCLFCSLSIDSLDKPQNKKLLPLKARALMRASPIRNPMLAVLIYYQELFFASLDNLL